MVSALDVSSNCDCTDTVEISEEGKVLLKGNTVPDSADSEVDVTKTDAVKEPVTYTKSGETVSEEQGPSISVSV